MVTDLPPTDDVTFSPSFALIPRPETLLWECLHDPELGWIVLAVDTKAQAPTFALVLSKEHQQEAHAKAICHALARIYNAQGRNTT